MGKESTFIPPQESASKRPNLNRAVENLQRMSVRDIGFLDIV